MGAQLEAAPKVFCVRGRPHLKMKPGYARSQRWNRASPRRLWSVLTRQTFATLLIQCMLELPCSDKWLGAHGTHRSVESGMWAASSSSLLTLHLCELVAQALVLPRLKDET
jgi:hypothetical protein